MSDSNTSLVVDPDKPLTYTQQRILEAELSGQYPTQKAMSDGLEIDEGNISQVRKFPNYIKRYNQERDKESALQQTIGKHTTKELKLALFKLKELVESDASLNAYGCYVKLLTDVARGTSDLDISDDGDELDEVGARADLSRLIELSQNHPTHTDKIIDYYIKVGYPPSEEDIVPKLEEQALEVCIIEVDKDGNL